MEVNAKTLQELEREGIVEVEDLEEFDKVTWKQVADNLHATVPICVWDKDTKEIAQGLKVDEWKELTDRKKDAQPAVPKITMELPVMHWIEAFDDFLDNSTGNKVIFSACN
eukprot:2079524-Ditylum_brightwellii.AAC.1